MTIVRKNRIHPNLVENYFEEIDTKNRAYWLGFLYADGCIAVDKRRGRRTKKVQIGLHKKDEWIIDRFIQCLGANKNKKEYPKRTNKVLIRITSEQLTSDLIKHGCTPRKTFTIELPNLKNRHLYLAFLLGFFDGDGKQDSTLKLPPSPPTFTRYKKKQKELK